MSFGSLMTQLNADEGTKNQESSGTNGRRNEPTSRPSPFHLCSSASSAEKNSEVSLSLTMIVRDEKSSLSHCHSSVAGLFHEIVVVDTGSTDRTAEIAREFGARVFDFVWVNGHGPAHRLHRPGATRAHAAARLQDPRGRAGRAARRSVRALQH